MRTSLALGVVLALSSAIVACGDKDGDTGADDTDTDTDGTDTDTDTDGTDTDTDGTDTDTDTDGTTEDDADGDGYAADEDCDDSDPAVNPGAAEICDDIDNDCDDLVDDDDDDLDAASATTWYVDADGDGFGNPDDSAIACIGPTDWVERGDDCDDGDSAVNPGATEICNDGIDDDCDGRVDDADDDLDTSTAGAFYADTDLDGWGDLDAPIAACAASEGVVSDTDDCDDGDAAVNPGATEICNDGIDDDCDGDIDDLDSSLDTTTWSAFYRDEDGDGYGLDGDTIMRCDAPEGFAAEPGDCDDGQAAANPGAAEICDGGIDNDCDGLADDADDDISEEDYPTWYIDEDGDGYGVEDATETSCEEPEGYAAEAGDCDDDDPDLNPGAAEICDGIDNDCDDLVDDADDDVDDETGLFYFADEDGDGWGADGEGTTFCTAPDDGYTDRGGDCDDDDADVNPDADEICDDIDNDCDELVDDEDGDLVDEASEWFVDADGDGYGMRGTDGVIACSSPGDGYATTNDDCDDEDADVHPDADEVCNDKDDDCDPTTTASGTAGWTDAAGTYTDLTDDLSVGTSESPVAWDMDEAGSLFLCEGDWYLNLTASADVTVASEGTEGSGDRATVYGGSDASILAVEGEGLTITVSNLLLSGGYGSGTTADSEVFGGGAIACTDETGTSTLTATDLRMGDHRAGQGGAFYAWGCDLVMDNVEIERSQADAGGGIYLLDADLTAIDLRVLGNGATDDGGGLWVGTSAGSATVSLLDSTITRNTATTGGGIWMGGSVEVDVESSTFELNLAELGAGVAIDGDTGTVLSVVDSDFGVDDLANSPDDIGLVGDESSYSGLGASATVVCDGTECISD